MTNNRSLNNINKKFGRRIYPITAVLAVLLCVLCFFLVSCNGTDEPEKDIDMTDIEDGNLSKAPSSDKLLLVLPSPEENETATETETSFETETEPMESYTKSLSYISNGDGTCTVCAMGSITDVCIVIPGISPSGEEVTGVSPMAFYGNRDIVAVEIPKSVKTIGELAFAACPRLVYISVDDDNENFCDEDGILYNKSHTELICCPDAFGAKRIRISEKVTKIHYMALYDCTSVERIDYSGTREEWELIDIEGKNYALASASVSFGNK